MKVIGAFICVVTMLAVKVRASDITPLVFGGFTEGMPAAFGDFNSDELTDVFVVLGKAIAM